MVVYGGYEHPLGTAYPGNVSLYGPVECAPCWLRDPCPNGKKCLDMITPAAAKSALKRPWDENRRCPVQQPAQ